MACAKKNSEACTLSNQGQHESVSRYRGVRFVVPTDIFRASFITGDLLAGAQGAGPYRDLRFRLAPCIVQYRAVLLPVLPDIAHVCLRLM